MMLSVPAISSRMPANTARPKPLMSGAPLCVRRPSMGGRMTPPAEFDIGASGPALRRAGPRLLRRPVRLRVGGAADELAKAGASRWEALLGPGALGVAVAP